MRKLILLISFFTVTPCVLLFSIVFFSFLLYQKNLSGSSLSFTRQAFAVSYTALPSTDNAFQTEITTQDNRIERVRNFFKKYHSPLEEYAEAIVSTADKYNLDYRLLPAIGMQESQGCKKVIADSKNCFGFGIYGKHVKKFDSYEQSIETVTKTLALHYKDKGLITPEEIGKLYNPSNTNNWVGGINFFIDQI